MARTLFVLLILVLVSRPAFSQGQQAETAIGWQHIPTEGFGKMPKRPPRSQAAKERVALKMAESQKKLLDPFIGLQFFGLCEVRSVRPATVPSPKDRAFIVTGAECHDLLEGKAGQVHLSQNGLTRKFVRWYVSKSDAMTLAPSQRFNVTGEIAKVVSAGSGRADDERIMVVELKSVSFP